MLSCSNRLNARVNGDLFTAGTSTCYYFIEMQHQWTVGAASSTHSVYITLHRLIIRFHWPRERRWWQLRRSYTDTAQKTGESSKDINSKVNIRTINSPSDWSDVPIIICIYIGPQLTGTYMQLKLAVQYVWRVISHFQICPSCEAWKWVIAIQQQPVSGLWLFLTF